MAYEINKSDGTVLVSVADGTLDSTTSVKLIGKNYVGYGEQIAENFVHMLEHFAKATEPSNPISGQLWFDTTANKVKVRDTNGNWKELGQLVSSATAPSSSVATTGDFWFDTTAGNLLLYIWNGTAWQPVGVGNNNTYVGYVEITDTASVIHECLVDVHDKKYMTISNGDAGPWTPLGTEVQPDGTTTVVSEFPTINKGINMTNAVTPASSSSEGYKYRGTATSAEYADVAERFAADCCLEPGDVVVLGGECEITKSTIAKDRTVVGVISGHPAFEMNAGAGDNMSHPFVALTGRVDVRVIGQVNKGDRLVTSDVPGVAKVTDAEFSNWETVIGRSLVNKDTEEEGLIEIIVGVK